MCDSLATHHLSTLGMRSDQRQFVAEQTRVARCWVITTPNKWFPVESHNLGHRRSWFPAWRRGRSEFTRLLSLRGFKKCCRGRDRDGELVESDLRRVLRFAEGSAIITVRATEAEVRPALIAV